MIRSTWLWLVWRYEQVRLVWFEWDRAARRDSIMRQAKVLLDKFYAKGRIDAVTPTGEPVTPQVMRAAFTEGGKLSARETRKCLAAFDAIHTLIRAKYGLKD